jgi:osmotically-inducible protein OsmY
MIKRIAQAAAVVAFALFVSAAPAVASDTWIHTKTKIALMTADDVAGHDIDVRARYGVVTLTGKVGSEAEKERAEHVARSIEGVKDVKNMLQVVPKAEAKRVEATDEQIEDQLETALKGQGLKDVEVDSVNAGVVVLKGKTSSLTQELTAIETAVKVPGVKHVDSRIQSPQK